MIRRIIYHRLIVADFPDAGRCVWVVSMSAPQPCEDNVGPIGSTAIPASTGAIAPTLGGGGRYRLLEAGRGAACLWVLFFHSINCFPIAGLPEVLKPVRAVGGWGWLGVEVFFAISGWCIAERIARGFRVNESGFHFAIERLLRIFPTYWAALAVLVAIRLAAVPFNSAHLSGCTPEGWQGWLGSILLLDTYMGRGSFLEVSWTLVYELGFYLCATIALMAATRRVVKFRVLFILGCLMCLFPWTAHGGSAPWRVLALWPDFFAGMAAWWAARRGSRASGYAVLVAMLAIATIWPTYWALERLTAIGTAWILALAYTWDDRLAKMPIMRPMIWAGGVSYSLYLIHVPLMSPFFNLAERWIPYTSEWFTAVWSLAIVMALIGAKYLNQLVEAPFELWRRRVF